MLCATFKNKEQEDFINENGYTIIKKFLDNLQIQYFKELYESQHKENEVGCWNSLSDLSIGVRRELSNKVVQVLNLKFQEIFNDPIYRVASFMSKNPNKGHESLVHRDYFMFNEEKIQYRQCWIPLVVINKKNGALYVVPKSHQLFDGERPMFLPWGYEHLKNRLEYKFKTLYVSAGDLVIYFDKTLHGSFLNDSHEKRPVLHGGIVHKDSEPYYIRYNPSKNIIEYYKVSIDFF